MPGGATMERLSCGDSMLKLLTLTPTPEASNPGGGTPAATGMRYFTLWVRDLADVLRRCSDASIPTAFGPIEFMPGLHLIIVEDPDGNWVEFVQGDQPQ